MSETTAYIPQERDFCLSSTGSVSIFFNGSWCHAFSHDTYEEGQKYLQNKKGCVKVHDSQDMEYWRMAS